MSNKTIAALAIVGGAFGYLINKRVTKLENQINNSLIKESETKPAKAESKRGRKPKTESK